jgi:hypothetical protein
MTDTGDAERMLGISRAPTGSRGRAARQRLDRNGDRDRPRDIRVDKGQLSPRCRLPPRRRHGHPIHQRGMARAPREAEGLKGRLASHELHRPSWPRRTARCHRRRRGTRALLPAALERAASFASNAPTSAGSWKSKWTMAPMIKCSATRRTSSRSTLPPGEMMTIAAPACRRAPRSRVPLDQGRRTP